MAERVVLHIGTMKSGTTYLQGGLAGGAAELEAAGAWYVGGSFAAQTGAVGGMLGPPARQQPERWYALAEEVRRREGVGVVSQEFLSFARPAHVDALLRPLEGLEVDVVVTVRDQRRAIPAQWQTYARNLGTSPWADFLRELEPMVTGADEPSLALRKFKRAQDVPAILRRWAGNPGVSSVRVVTVPAGGSDPTELWHRFCRALRLDVAVPAGARAAANESLGYASCHLLTWLNRYTTVLPKPVYRRARTRAVRLLLPLRGSEGRPVLDRAGVALADTLNQRITDAVDHPRVVAVDPLAELAHDGGADDVPAAVPPPDEEEVRRAVEVVWEDCLPAETVPSDLDTAVARLGEHLTDWARDQQPDEGGDDGGPEPRH